MVWVPRNGAKERHVERVTKTVTDARATHYWDGHGKVVGPYDEMFSLTGPCAGIFMLFDRDVPWQGTAPPEPGYWEDAHARELRRKGIQFDPERFAEKAAALLRADRP